MTKTSWSATRTFADPPDRVCWCTSLGRRQTAVHDRPCELGGPLARPPGSNQPTVGFVLGAYTRENPRHVGTCAKQARSCREDCFALASPLSAMRAIDRTPHVYAATVRRGPLHISAILHNGAQGGLRG